MTNPIIDALQWYPENPARSVRELQQALMDLQEEWALKLAPLGQISRNGQVYETDWDVFESDRQDATFLHFDNETPQFIGEWANLYGIVRSVDTILNPGRSEFTLVTVSGNRVAITGPATGTVITATINLKRAAKFFVVWPIMVEGNGTVTFNLKIDTVSKQSFARISAAVWEVATIIYASAEYAAGSHTILLEATSSGVSVNEFAQIAPVPNVTGTTPLGIITPSLAYVEAIYQ